MANLVANKTISVNDSPEVIVAALETALELQDSTNNPIQLIDIVRQPNGFYAGVLITTGTIA